MSAMVSASNDRSVRSQTRLYVSHLKTRAISCLGIALLFGCGTDLSQDGPLTIDGLPVLTIEADMRLGSFDDPNLGFTQVDFVDVGRDGRIYVFERSQQQIRVHDSDGSLIHRIGREGDGPGEFRRAFHFGVHGDTIWVIDSGTERITLFDRDGTVLSAKRVDPIRIPTPGCYGRVRPIAMRPDGYFTSDLNSISCGEIDPINEGVNPDSIPVPRVRFRATGGVVDTIGWDSHPPPRMVRPPGAEGPTPRWITIGERQYRVPSGPSTLASWYPLNDGRIILETPLPKSGEDSFLTLTRLGMTGDTVYHRALHFSPLAYTVTDKDSIAVQGAGRVFGFFANGSPIQPEADAAQLSVAAERLRAEMSLPPYRIPIQQTWIGRDETIWLLRDEPEGAPSGLARWIKLDPEGLPVGEFELPLGTRIAWSGPDSFWAVENDEFDVPWVVRYRILGSS